MYKILKLNKISEKIDGLYNHDLYEVSDELENPDAVIVRSANMHEMKFENNLLAIARAGAGTNTIPVEECKKKGIVVFNTPGANANAVKEMVVCAMIMSARNVKESIDWTNGLQNLGDEVPEKAERGKSNFNGYELIGKTLGVMGLGATGGLVAEAAISLGMKVIGYDPHLALRAALRLNNNVKQVGIDELLSKSDFVSVHIPLTPDTKYMINGEMMAKMKKGVILLNFSRADLVNRTDLKTAIENKIISKYVVDFPTCDILNTANIICLPHLASSTTESEDNCAVMAINELIDYIENGNIVNSVNYPECVLNRVDNCSRITVLHINKPGVINSITNIIHQKGLNILNMVSASKDDVAYSILDVEGDLNDIVFDDVENIIRIRIL